MRKALIDIGLIISTVIDDMLDSLIANPFWFGMQPYTALLGNLFWGIFFGFIGGGIYIGSDNIYALVGYLMLIGIFMGAVIPGIIMSIFGLILGVVMAVLIFRALVRKKSE